VVFNKGKYIDIDAQDRTQQETLIARIKQGLPEQ